tara:strand:- start:1115 stop:2452 length:1338 start_codon:yes stop_codon:yes gene_type:complete
MKLFGTDGIRGKFGVFPLDESTIRKLGAALSEIYSKDIKKFFIAHDGRLSHKIICEELLKGILSSHDFEIIFLGLHPTPSIPYILSEQTEKDSMGIQITASHNPYSDNGLKIFNSDGYKISFIDENKITQILESINDVNKKIDYSIFENESYTNDYTNYLSFFSKKYLDDSKKMHVAIDCANGALSDVIKSIRLPKNISLTVFSDKPNGKNINNNCGAVYPEYLSKVITQKNRNLCSSDHEWIDFGMTFDGDGDRAILISETGRIIDGDEILFILCSSGIKKTLVGTLMTNFGIRASLEKIGHTFIETDVGDKYVLEAILNNNAFMGSESSGHVIHTDACKIPTGDAMITLIKMIYILQSNEASVNEIYPKSLKIPSKLINIKTTNSKKFIENNHSKFKKVEELLSENGRILVRESGTQPMVRILIEHKSPDILKNAEKIVKSIL